MKFNQRNRKMPLNIMHLAQGLGILTHGQTVQPCG
jgi:hypothetical protein